MSYSILRCALFLLCIIFISCQEPNKNNSNKVNPSTENNHFTFRNFSDLLNAIDKILIDEKSPTPLFLGLNFGDSPKAIYGKLDSLTKKGILGYGHTYGIELGGQIYNGQLVISCDNWGKGRLESVAIDFDYINLAQLEEVLERNYVRGGRRISNEIRYSSVWLKDNTAIIVETNKDGFRIEYIPLKIFRKQIIDEYKYLINAKNTN